ncbi:hypothetical protein H4W30_003796 [Amycolatopsis roodepoortensis]|uniref:Uncharacterized protein n=1 Tax=Amycolatopsis roodepoortensis TaxID=700274 RepID=A0ABR9L7S5_9PSEU|nr:hypothetical protein [Amycolatopsis roodepoortensis]
MVFVIQVVPGGAGGSASYRVVLGWTARATRGRLGAKTADRATGHGLTLSRFFKTARRVP